MPQAAGKEQLAKGAVRRLICSAIRTCELGEVSSLSADRLLLRGSLSGMGSDVFSEQSLGNVLGVECFVDDGCSGFALMDFDFARLNGIKIIPLLSSEQFNVTLADGSSGGLIRYKTQKF